MKTQCALAQWIGGVAMVCALTVSTLAADGGTNDLRNYLIDYDTFLTNAADVGRLREKRRLTEEQFIDMAAQAGTVVYDARSDDKFTRLHIKGAKHLSFS